MPGREERCSWCLNWGRSTIGGRAMERIRTSDSSGRKKGGVDVPMGSVTGTIKSSGISPGIALCLSLLVSNMAWRRAMSAAVLPKVS
eukprot:4318093-Pyramimonas_sp.AAC.1